MSIIQGIVLGVLQGVAEFLPISSSGHLKVAQCLFGLEEVPLLFDVFLHLSTLCAVVLFFRKKIWDLIKSFVSLLSRKDLSKMDLTELAQEKDKRLYIAAIVAATFVTASIGLVTSKLIDDDVISVKIICAGFIVTSLLLISSSLMEKRREQKGIIIEEKSPNLIQALLIGLAQGIGTLPGISRSGSTIAGSLFCGVNRSVAGEFSFIVSIPAILGAFLLEVKDLGEVASAVGAEPIIAGCAAAFASGYISLTWLMKLIKKGRLEWFACYLIPAGILGILFL